MSSAPAPPTLRFFVVNAQGLSHPQKLPSILRWLREKKAHGAIITETQVSADPADILRTSGGAGTIWPGMRIFHVPGTGHTEGVMLVLGPGSRFGQPVQFQHPSGPSGRILRVDLSLYDQPVSVIGVYGPAQQQQRAAFYRDALPSHLPMDGRPLLLAGDFNVVLSDLDCWYPADHAGLAGPNSRLVGSQELSQLMAAHNLKDIFRMQGQARGSFTHYSRSANSGARLDRVLLNDAFLGTFRSCRSSILPACGFHTDHLPVSLSFRAPAPSIPCGSGILSFPLAVLNMPAAVEEIAAIITQRRPAVMAAPSATAWDNLKGVLRDESVRIYRKHRHLRQAAARAADRAAVEANRLLAANQDPAMAGPLLAASKAAGAAAAQAWKELLEPAELSAEILDHQFGDKSSFYFFRGARMPVSPTVISSLNRPGRDAGAAPDSADLSLEAGRDLALKYACDFYASDSPCGLFRARPHVQAAQDAALSSMQPKLPARLQHLAEGPDGDSLLTLEDIEYALAASRRDSCPGGDGLPYEFYRAFKDQLSPILRRVFNAAFLAGQEDDAGYAEAAPLSPLLRSVICLLPKAGQPTDELAGYRPISLLNCDVKLVMLVLSNRLQRPLDFIIDVVQSAFLRGRDISDNVRYHLGLRARLQELGLPAWLLHSDLTKAYDSVSRPLLIRILQHMGLRNTGIIHWTRILLNGTSAQVRVNGFLSPFFPVDAVSIPQGGALSCQLWLAVAHLFTSYLSTLQHSRQLSSFPLPSGRLAPASGVFADDITVPVLLPSELSSTVRPAFQLLAQAGAPAQSAAKTALQHLSGPVPPELDPAVQQQHPASGYSILDAEHDRGLRHLGVPFAASLADRVSAAFAAQPHSMRAAGSKWAAAAPNLLGRVLVSAQCLASKAVYQANFHSPTPELLSQMQQAVNSFVASPMRREEVSPNPSCLYPCARICHLPRAAGGVGLPDLAAHFAAMLAKPCWLLFGYVAHPWADLFGHEVASAALPLAAGAAVEADQGPADARLGLPPGPHWLVTRPAAGRSSLDRIATESFRASARAFLELGVQRICQPADQDFWSIMLELTFSNPPPSRPGIDVRQDVSTPAGRSWLRLRDVRRAFLGRHLLQPDEAADLQAILDRLPPEWLAAVRAPQEPASSWAAIHAPGADLLLFEGPDPMAEGSPAPPSGKRLWLLFRNSGRLEPYDDPSFVRDASVVPRPVLVITKAKPRAAWSRADFNFMEDQRALPQADRRELLEPWLLGFWDALQLDPRVWGLHPRSARGAPRASAAGGAPPDQPEGCVPLLGMSVRAARHSLCHSRALGRSVPGYRSHGAVWPALWAQEPAASGPSPAPLASAPVACLRKRGLEGLEELWRRQAPSPPTDADVLDRVPAWLDLHRVQPPGPSAQAQRAAGRAALAAPGPVSAPDFFSRLPVAQSGFPDVWRRLLDPALHRPFAITAWLLLHGKLGCRAFLHHVQRQLSFISTPCSALCPSPACSAAGQAESLTHAFLECPDSAPAVDWLCAAWGALTGKAAPPRSAAVLLADELRFWTVDSPAGDTPLLALWTRLRVSVIGSIWKMRCARAQGSPHRASMARMAVQEAVSSLVRAMKRDWLRTTTDIRSLDNGSFCTEWWRGLDPQLSLAKFRASWAHRDLFCVVDGGDAGAAPPRAPSLSLRLGVDLPLPFPA